jgi:co-chaperonin GroES (HSP10)
MSVLKESERPKWDTQVKWLIEHSILRPGIGRVLIARDPRQDKVGSLIADPRYIGAEQKGTVVALGRRRENAMGSPVDFVFEVGDRVIINEIAGKNLPLNGVELAIVPEDEIIVSMHFDDTGS